MNIRRFDRHEHMDGDTRSAILHLISEVGYNESLHNIDTWSLENKLYGLFDGYDYSEKIMNSDVITEIKESSPETYNELSRICEIVSNYPTANWN